ncbi:MAG TPA: hypothetical protein VJ141_04515 [Candidatus Limnocylindrales bacterium]|nr:hypothetical protein [Candidatus Limnocylindrales bacterium]
MRVWLTHVYEMLPFVVLADDSTMIERGSGPGSRPEPEGRPLDALTNGDVGRPG